MVLRFGKYQNLPVHVLKHSCASLPTVSDQGWWDGARVCSSKFPSDMVAVGLIKDMKERKLKLSVPSVVFQLFCLQMCH